jgi:hypothetical protein
MGRQEMKNIQILFSGIILMVLLPCMVVFGQNQYLKNFRILSRHIRLYHSGHLNTPIENVVAMFDALKEFNKIKQI